MRLLRLLIVFYLVMLCSVESAIAAGPELTVSDPLNGTVLQQDFVTLQFTTANIKLVPTTIPVAEAGKHPDVNKQGEGHLHFVLDLQPLVVWETSDPYTFHNLLPGQHQLMVELVENDHSSLSPAVMQMIQFEIAPEVLPSTGTDSLYVTFEMQLLTVLALLLLAAGSVVLRHR